MKIDHDEAIYCHSGNGPTFDGDIIIGNNANATMCSFSQLGYAFKHPHYEEDTNEAQTFLVGSHQFQLD
jgi:hypothetical protein